MFEQSDKRLVIALYLRPLRTRETLLRSLPILVWYDPKPSNASKLTGGERGPQMTGRAVPFLCVEPGGRRIDAQSAVLSGPASRPNVWQAFFNACAIGCHASLVIASSSLQ